MDRKTAFEALGDRCFTARVPMALVCDKAGVARSTPSRWAGNPDMIRALTLRKLETALDWFEAMPMVCGTCDRQSSDSSTWNCTRMDCGMQRERAA